MRLHERVKKALESGQFDSVRYYDRFTQQGVNSLNDHINRLKKNGNIFEIDQETETINHRRRVTGNQIALLIKNKKETDK